MTVDIRVAKLRQIVAANNLQGLITTRRENVFYLTNLNIEAVLLITLNDCFAIVPPMYEEETPILQNSWNLVIATESLIKEASRVVHQLPINTWGCEPEYLSHAAWKQLRDHVQGSLNSATGILDSLRAIKDPQEVQLLKEARSSSLAALGHIENLLQQGVSEKDVALEIVAYIMKQADGIAFDPIVLFGERTSLPHGTPSRRVLTRNDYAVLIDLGAKIEGYHGDITRTILLNGASQRWHAIYECVQQLQEMAIGMLRPGLACREVDAAIREVAAQKGFGDNIRHSLGHGVGLAVHEYPFLGKSGTGELQENMIVTVEPGLYFPGWGGVRIEEMVQVTQQGGRIIS